MSTTIEAISRTERSRACRMRVPVLTLAGLAAATTAVALRDPHVQGSWGVCPSAVLGFSCPGCGGMRAVHDLTNLRLVEAASSNFYFVAVVPVILAVLGIWTVDRWRGVQRGLPTPAVPLLVMAGVALATFTVLRNLPPFGWLAP